MPTPPDRPDDSPREDAFDGDGPEKFPTADDAGDDCAPGDCAPGECTCGECDDMSEFEGAPVDWVLAARRYQIALADYRLDRGHLLWPAVAAVVDAAFVMCDPVGLLSSNTNPGASFAYERAATRVWSGLWSAMLDTIGDRSGVLSLQEQQVHDVVWSTIDDEFGDEEPVSADVADDRRFAEIIEHAFGAFTHQSAVPNRADSAFSIRADRVTLMVQLLSERLADFPWDSDEPF